MPLVQIHLIRNTYTPTQIRKMADLIQQVMESHFNAPPRDRYQIITQHEPYELICEETNLPDLPRGEKLIFLHIFQQGRDAEVKQRSYKEFRMVLGEEFGIGEFFLNLFLFVLLQKVEDFVAGVA